MQSLEVYAPVSLAIADAFISCWDEKYRSLVIRPETYINKYIDGSWMPLLQTPPFPEYTSGHSVVSTASAIVLTKLFGDGFAFSDSTEMEFDLLPRSFTSFKQAAAEGQRIGEFVVQKIQTRQQSAAKKAKGATAAKRKVSRWAVARTGF